jgi:hypothetical protein
MRNVLREISCPNMLDSFVYVDKIITETVLVVRKLIPKHQN